MSSDVGSEKQVRKSETRFPIPNGLRSLLEAVAREVIRDQPNDVYAFAALFFDKVLEYRIKTNVNPIENVDYYEVFKDELLAEASRRHLTGVPKSAAEKDLSQGTCDESSDKTVVSAKKSLEPEKAATKIQAAARGFVTRRRVKRDRASLENARRNRPILNDAYDPGRKIRKPKKSTTPAVVLSKIESEERADDPEKEKAATKIQAGVRGFLARRRCTRIRQEQNHAATVIQSTMKGYLTRKHLEAEGIPVRRMSRSPSPRSRLSEPDVARRKSSDDAQNLNLHAAKIQAGIRGYLTRKHMEEKGLKVRHPDKSRSRSHSPQSSDTSATDIVSGIPKLPEATVSKIEAGVRGYLTKKHMNEQANAQKSAAGGESPIAPQDSTEGKKQQRRSPSATKIPVFVSSPQAK